MFIRWTQSIAKPADDIRHRAPSSKIAWRKALQLGLALFLIIIELNAGAVFERDE
jgi:hypothetical protein